MWPSACVTEVSWRALVVLAAVAVAVAGVVGMAVYAVWQLATSSFHPIRWDNAWLLVGMGVAATLAQLCMTRAYRTGNTLVVGSFSDSTIVFGTLAMVLVWDEGLSWAGWAGMGIIVASGIIAMRVEKKEQVEEGGFEG